MTTKNTPVVLLGVLPRLDDSSPAPGTRYSTELQLWVDADGTPIVAKYARAWQSSDFGETHQTLSREGIDQTEGETFLVSDYGETTVTKSAEGVDATESFLSDYGEASVTATGEGADQSEALGERCS